MTEQTQQRAEEKGDAQAAGLTLVRRVYIVEGKATVGLDLVSDRGSSHPLDRPS